MATAGSPKLRALLQEFVDARIDAPELFAQAGKLLPRGSDPSEEVLELLAEADLKLQLPAGREAFARRLEQFAEGETSYTELDLWCFSLGQTEPLAADGVLIPNPEVRLLRTVVEWVEEWEDDAQRPPPSQVRTLARILRREADPRACLERLEQARAGFERD
ncbi:MAG: hypothetical protein ACE5G6_08270 [Terriglobia bacterium]